MFWHVGAHIVRPRFLYMRGMVLRNTDDRRSSLQNNICTGGNNHAIYETRRHRR